MKALLTVTAVLLAWAYLLGTAEAQKAPKEPKVTVVLVDCSDPKQSIQAALDKVSPGVPTTIFITGVCNENVTIKLNDITLQGLDPASSQIIGVPEVDPLEESPITIHGAQRIIIDNLTVAGADSSGIVVITAVATVSNSVIKDNTNGGIFVGPGAWVRIDENTIQGNRDGIRVANGGFGQITNNLIQNNSRDGIVVRGSASAFIGVGLGSISGPNTIQLNKRNGILLRDNASARIQDNVIFKNNTEGQGFGGIGIVRGASANLRGGNTISENTNNGIGMAQGVLDMGLGFPSTTPNVIELNTNDGIGSSNGSSIRMSSGTINDNGDDGIFARNGSSVEMRGGTINNNGDDGIFANNGSSIRMSGGTIKENISAGIVARDGSSVEMRGGAIQLNGGRGIELAQSSLRIFNSTVQNNVGDGIVLFRDSGVAFRSPAATVSGNGGVGGLDLACAGSESSFSGSISQTSGVGNIGFGCTGF